MSGVTKLVYVQAFSIIMNLFVFFFQSPIKLVFNLVDDRFLSFFSGHFINNVFFEYPAGQIRQFFSLKD